MQDQLVLARGQRLRSYAVEMVFDWDREELTNPDRKRIWLEEARRLVEA
jgi:Ni/Co efflux regulator RcnB